MDFHTAVKLGHQRGDFSAVSMLTPLQTYTPQIVDECYGYSSSPEPKITPFSHFVEKRSHMNSGRLTPQTPESFSFNEPVSISDPFDQYLQPQIWPQDAQMPIGLGFENDIPGLMPSETDMRMWTPEFDGNATPTGNMDPYTSSVGESPVPADVWPTPAFSVSPPQIPHTRAVPSLSISECSAQDSNSPNPPQDDWPNFQGHPGDMVVAKPHTSTAFFNGMKPIPMDPQIWDENMLTRTSTRTYSIGRQRLTAQPGSSTF
jgi:hypothetical protein